MKAGRMTASATLTAIMLMSTLVAAPATGGATADAPAVRSSLGGSAAIDANTAMKKKERRERKDKYDSWGLFGARGSIMLKGDAMRSHGDVGNAADRETTT